MVQYQYLNNLPLKRRIDSMPVHTYTNWNKREGDSEKPEI